LPSIYISDVIVQGTVGSFLNDVGCWVEHGPYQRGHSCHHHPEPDASAAAAAAAARATPAGIAAATEHGEYKDLQFGGIDFIAKGPPVRILVLDPSPLNIQSF